MAKSPVRFPPAMPAVVVLALVASALPSTNANAASEGAEGRPVPNAANVVEVDTYRAEMIADGAYKAGAAGSVKIKLTAKAGFHINGQYPYRFKASAAAEGVSYPKPVLERADGQFEEKSAVFTLPFVAGHAGKFAVGGVLNLSVCSPASCIVKKAPLEVSVTVQ